MIALLLLARAPCRIHDERSERQQAAEREPELRLVCRRLAPVERALRLFVSRECLQRGRSFAVPRALSAKRRLVRSDTDRGEAGKVTCGLACISCMQRPCDVGAWRSQVL